jgi:hypothetical protein
MRVEWDYTGSSFTYLKRPDYTEVAIDCLFYLTSVADRVRPEVYSKKRTCKSRI